MKILQIIYSLGAGGAERFVVDLSNELSKHGHEVTLCTLRDDAVGIFGFYKPDISKKVDFISLKIPEGFNLRNISILFNLIKRVNPCIVHCHLNLVDYIFPLTFYFERIKFFHTIHNDASKEVNGKLEYIIRRFFYSTLKTKAITISKESSRSFVDLYKGNFYHEIYNGCLKPKASKEFSIVKDEINALKKAGNVVFLHIGRCSVQKNQEMLVNIFNKLEENCKRAVLLIIGPGFDSLKGQDLQKKACEKILFLGEKHNVSDYLLCADAFCLSSLYEGMPISLIEAFACGCTPICTPVGGILNAIVDGETGYLSQSIFEIDYYNAVIKYLENQKKITSESLIKYYYSRFSIEECVKNHLHIYQI